jgi:hypothetical protein
VPGARGAPCPTSRGEVGAFGGASCLPVGGGGGGGGGAGRGTAIDACTHSPAGHVPPIVRRDSAARVSPSPSDIYARPVQRDRQRGYSFILVSRQRFGDEEL